jgi:hypothetical protein
MYLFSLLSVITVAWFTTIEFTSEYILGDAMKIFILFYDFGNVSNFTVFEGTIRVLQRVASGVDVSMIDPRADPNIHRMLLYNTSTFRVRIGCI